MRLRAEKRIRAGYKVTVIDASDPDWWRGKCLGQIGFFPSKYVAKLAPNEKPLQVTHNLQLGGNDGDGTDSDPNRLTKLLRDQVQNLNNTKSQKSMMQSRHINVTMNNFFLTTDCDTNRRRTKRDGHRT